MSSTLQTFECNCDDDSVLTELLQIFDQCNDDVNTTGAIPVSFLISQIAPTFPWVQRYSVDSIRQISQYIKSTLDPDNCNILVTREAFKSAMTDLISSVNNNEDDGVKMHEEYYHLLHLNQKLNESVRELRAQLESKEEALNNAKNDKSRINHLTEQLEQERKAKFILERKCDELQQEMHKLRILEKEKDSLTRELAAKRSMLDSLNTELISLKHQNEELLINAEKDKKNKDSVSRNMTTWQGLCGNMQEELAAKEKEVATLNLMKQASDHEIMELLGSLKKLRDEKHKLVIEASRMEVRLYESESRLKDLSSHSLCYASTPDTNLSLAELIADEDEDDMLTAHLSLLHDTERHHTLREEFEAEGAKAYLENCSMRLNDSFSGIFSPNHCGTYENVCRDPIQEQNAVIEELQLKLSCKANKNSNISLQTNLSSDVAFVGPQPGICPNADVMGKMTCCTRSRDIGIQTENCSVNSLDASLQVTPCINSVSSQTTFSTNNYEVSRQTEKSMPETKGVVMNHMISNSLTPPIFRIDVETQYEEHGEVFQHRKITEEKEDIYRNMRIRDPGVAVNRWGIAQATNNSTDDVFCYEALERHIETKSKESKQTHYQRSDGNRRYNICSWAFRTLLFTCILLWMMTLVLFFVNHLNYSMHHGGCTRIPGTWTCWEEILRPYVQLKHLSPPPV